MISGAYSKKYKAAQDEHVQRLKEQARIDGQNIKDRVKELSKETNRRRKALESRKKELAEEEERNRQAVLSERHKKKEEATQKFQKDFQKKKARPCSGTQQTDESHEVVEDGIRVVRGHIVAIRNGQQVTVPTLEDALNMVNNPYNENTVLYHGSQDLYSNSKNSLDYGLDPFDDQPKLREDALQNGGPMFAFMNGQITEGALPQTVRRNSPSGSLTSLDSLDEVPTDQLPLQENSTQIPGIIVKDKVKSAGRRRVTFSDSIEFDDGLTGQLVTAEKESCKQYVKQYNSRMAASNATYSTSTSKPNSAVAKASLSPGKTLGMPGNPPIKSGEIPNNVPLASSGSMVVPMSVYSQLQCNKPIASTGESTFSTDTHTDRPQQCVAEVESSDNHSKDDVITNDSLDVIEDSLEDDGTPQYTDQPLDDSLDVKQEQTNPNPNPLGDDIDRHDCQSDNSNIDYYGNPATIYKNPFGQRNTSKDTSQTNIVAKQPEPRYGYAPDLLLESAGDYIAGSDTRNPIYQSNASAMYNSHANTQSSSAPNTTYYKSWYPGSFFSSKTVFGDEAELDKVVKKTNSVAYDLIDDRENITNAKQKSRKVGNLNKTNSKSTGRVNPLGKPDLIDDINQNEEQTSDQVKNGKQDTGGSKVIARPPHPSTRHKGVVYSSPLHRKRALASAKRTTGKNSPKSPTRRSPVVKSKEPVCRNQITPERFKEKNIKNHQKGRGVGSGVARGHSQTSRGNSSSSDEEDELLQNIQRDMERISMLNNASPAQEEHQKILNTFNFADSPVPVDNSPKANFKSVYKKVHKPRVGSAKARSQLVLSNRGQPSKIPVYLGPSGNTSSKISNHNNRGMSSSVNHPWNCALDQTDRQDSTTHDNSGKDLVHPQTAALRQSIPLDKTPTDDEINILWDRVRNCLHHKDTQSVGSDSCVNRIDVRRSRTQDSHYMTYYSTRDTSLPRNSRAASITGLGSMRRYGSQEVLRRYGSADNIGPCRQQPLLQHRAHRTRQSGQGKPPAVPRQQFSPVASRQTPVVTLSTRAGPTPLTQNELRAVMKASQQEAHQPVTRTGPSALSIEENKLLQSLDRLNEQLKVQETLTANINRRQEHPSSSLNSRPTNHQRSSSAIYKHR